MAPNRCCAFPMGALRMNSVAFFENHIGMAARVLITRLQPHPSMYSCDEVISEELAKAFGIDHNGQIFSSFDCLTGEPFNEKLLVTSARLNFTTWSKTRFTLFVQPVLTSGYPTHLR